MKEKIKKLGELINKSNKILVINHVRMDVDAFGGLACMYDILKQIGKDVRAINDEKPIEKFSFLGFNDIVETNLDIKEFNPDLIISFDAASLDQLGKYYSENIDLFEEKDFVVIDHHISNPGFGKINIIDINYSSTCELTFDILTQLELDKYINKKIATTLLSGIYTDTNIFYNTNTSANTYYVTGKLIELGADFRKPYYEFYMKRTFSGSKLWGEVLANRMKSIENGKVVYAFVTKDIFEKTETNNRQLEGLVSEFFANIEGVEICFLGYELDDGGIKFSFRSSEKYDISKLCQKFGGGGHKQAAGFTSNKSINQIEKEIIEEIKKELK